jgi:hypothetical protein
VAATPTDSDAVLVALLDTIIYPSLDGKKASIVDQITAVSLVGAIAQRAPTKLGSHLEAKHLVAKVMAVSQVAAGSGDDMDEEDRDEAAAVAQTETSEAVLLVRCPFDFVRIVWTSTRRPWNGCCSSARRRWSSMSSRA